MLATLYALTSCGISTTGPVEAGPPAGGVVPKVRLYFVRDGALVVVPRRTVAPVSVAAAVTLLLRGPSRPERAKGITTQLAAHPVRVRTSGERVLIELSPLVGKVTETAVAQVVCTALDAQRVADPGAEPAPVTVTGADHRRLRGSAPTCPAA
ncbi:hypothetical protein [Streptomyces flavalbus]|uniref:GerMN domain-containing protein n=1 Tax=Streptomyces flavalbus TaxID=2665155 RepID=A0ABW2W5K6_9ACTN